MSVPEMNYEYIIQQYLAEFETLTMESLHSTLLTLLDAQIEFKDPFNHVNTSQQYRLIFEHMFDNCDSPSFHVNHYFVKQNRASVYWRFEFKTRQKSEIKTMIGNSYIEVNEQGLICRHIDYWDSAEQFYEHIPLIGWVIKQIKRRLQV